MPRKSGWLRSLFLTRHDDIKVMILVALVKIFKDDLCQVRYGEILTMVVPGPEEGIIPGVHSLQNRPSEDFSLLD